MNDPFSGIFKKTNYGPKILLGSGKCQRRKTGSKSGKNGPGLKLWKGRAGQDGDALPCPRGGRQGRPAGSWGKGRIEERERL